MNNGLAHMPFRIEELLKSFIIILIIQTAFHSRRNIKCTEWEHQCHAECDLILEFLLQFQIHTMNTNTFGMPVNMYRPTYEDLNCTNLIGLKNNTLFEHQNWYLCGVLCIADMMVALLSDPEEGMLKVHDFVHMITNVQHDTIHCSDAEFFDIFGEEN